MRRRARSWPRRWGWARGASSRRTGERENWNRGGRQGGLVGRNFMAIGRQQCSVPCQIIAPVPGDAAPPLLTQGLAQLAQQAQPALRAVVGDLMWPQRDEAGQIAASDIGAGFGLGHRGSRARRFRALDGFGARIISSRRPPGIIFLEASLSHG